MSNEIELAALRAKEIISLAEDKAKAIIESAKNPQKDILRLAEDKAKDIIELAKGGKGDQGALKVVLDYIQRDLNEIKIDIKEIKNDYIVRREFDTRLKDLDGVYQAKFKTTDDSIKFSTNVIYSIFAVLGTAFLVGLIKIFIK